MDPFLYVSDALDRALDALDLRNDETRPFTGRVTVEPPRDPSHGDIATNVAMVLAKPLRTKPRDLAERFAAEMRNDGAIASVEVAGPGFLNLRLDDTFWRGTLRAAVADADWGRLAIGGGERVNVEYVSANPTGPMHVGHCRGAVVGDALANLLDAAGFDVTREYYVNDAGGQIDVLARSVHLRYREALGHEVGTIPAGLYPGDYLVPVGRALADRYGDQFVEAPENAWIEPFRQASIDAMLELIRDDLAALNVRHHVFFSERNLHLRADDGSAIDRTIAALEADGHVYRGTLPPPKGAQVEDWEDREQLLLRSTAVGDDSDRALQKSDGSYTYFAADVAYFADKHARGFDREVFVLGADHGGYVKRLQAVARAVAGEAANLEVILVQLVRLFRDGELVRMSKRSGDLVTLREVVDEVGVDAVRFMMLYRKADAPLDFDFAKVTEKSKDNPVFYVQYAHARCQSVFRQAREAMPEWSKDEIGADIDLNALNDPTEIALVRKVAEYPRMLAKAAEAMEPHRVAFYLYDLASAFHVHWNLGKDRPELRFVNAEHRSVSNARLALVEGIRRTLAKGLAIVGASAPDEMR